MYLTGIHGVIFDLDGTLVDSETYTERSVDELLAELGIQHEHLEYHRFHGVTWERAEALLVEQFPELAGKSLATELADRFHRLCQEEPPPLVPGARTAVAAAGQLFPTAIASSSNRAVIELFVDRLDVGSALRLVVGAEDFSRSKPHPDCFLVAARRLGVEPSGCLVFEDSLAGLTAARAAGMTPVAVTGCAPLQDARERRRVAQKEVLDFTELPPDFFEVAGRAQG